MRLPVLIVLMRADGISRINLFTIDNQTIPRVAAIWRLLAEMQDALAQDGLVFLQRAFV